MLQKRLRKQVEILKLRKQPTQRTTEWYKARWNRLTASDVASALRITQKDLERAERGIFAFTKPPKIGKCCNPYDNGLTLIRKKCVPLGERKFQGNVYTRWGQKYEPVATMIYEHRNQTKVHEFGLMLHPTIEILGASPDGICDSGVMLEIKCPFSRTITGVTPIYYWIQMQIQLEVCDLEECDFLECKISEYRDRLQFELDQHETDPRLSCIGLEKGALIEIKKNDDDLDPTYVYVPLGTSEEIHAWIDRWIAEEIEAHPQSWMFTPKRARVVYWRLEKQSCVRVARDREWFQDSLPQLLDTWKQIQYYRKHGVEHLPSKTCDIGKKTITVNVKSYKEQQHSEQTTTTRTSYRRTRQASFSMFRSDSDSD
jgi:putative phage-type endonuclease